MPKIYLSPSTQEYNPYVTGAGSEEYFMNLLADAMEPILLLNGIQFSRNTPDMTAASSIRQANAGQYDFYLALHSNAAPEGQYGTSRGSIAFYYPGSIQGKWAADIIANNLRSIYPLPDKVRAVSTTTLGEVRKVRAPAVLLELFEFYRSNESHRFLEFSWKLSADHNCDSGTCHSDSFYCRICDRKKHGKQQIL